MERPWQQDGRRVEREKGVRRGPLAGDVGTALGVWGAVTVQGAGCGEKEWRADPGGCVDTCWAGRVRCEVEAALLDRTSQAVTDCNTKQTVTTQCSQKTKNCR